MKRQKRRNRWRVRQARDYAQLMSLFQVLQQDQQRREETEKRYQEAMAEIGDSLNSVAYAVGSSPSAMKDAIRSLFGVPMTRIGKLDFSGNGLKLDLTKLEPMPTISDGNNRIVPPLTASVNDGKNETELFLLTIPMSEAAKENSPPS